MERKDNPNQELLSSTERAFYSVRREIKIKPQEEKASTARKAQPKIEPQTQQKIEINNEPRKTRAHSTKPLRFSKENLAGVHSHLPDLNNSQASKKEEIEKTDKLEERNRDNLRLGVFAAAGAALLVGGAVVGYLAGREDTPDIYYVYPGQAQGYIPPGASLPPTETQVPQQTTQQPEQTPQATAPAPKTYEPQPTSVAPDPLENLPPLPEPIEGAPNQPYLLDGWYLIDGDIFIKPPAQQSYIRTYDDIAETAQFTVAGPDAVVNSLYGFTAYPLTYGDGFDFQSENVQEYIDSKINEKFNDPYEYFSTVYVDMLDEAGNLIDIKTAGTPY